MKKYFSALIVFTFFLVSYSFGQTPALELSKSVAKRMADSLSLSKDQQQQIFSINMKIHHTKLKTRTIPPGPNSSLRNEIQKIENSRDSLYSGVLTSSQYQLYLQKKENLISSN